MKGRYLLGFLYGAGVTDEATTATLMAYEEKYIKPNVQEKWLWLQCKLIWFYLFRAS